MQQHGSNYFARRPPHTYPHPHPGGVNRSTSSEHDHIAYHIKGNHEMQQHFARMPPTPRFWGCGQYVKFNFSEHGPVAYQIKGNQEMQQHDSKHFDPLPTFFHPPHTHDPEEGSIGQIGGLRVWSQKVKIQLFQNMVILHIKLKEITNAAAW